MQEGMANSTDVWLVSYTYKRTHSKRFITCYKYVV